MRRHFDNNNNRPSKSEIEFYMRIAYLTPPPVYQSSVLLITTDLSRALYPGLCLELWVISLSHFRSYLASYCRLEPMARAEGVEEEAEAEAFDGSEYQGWGV